MKVIHNKISNFNSSIYDVKNNNKPYRIRSISIGKGVFATEPMETDSNTYHYLNKVSQQKMGCRCISTNSVIKDADGIIVEDISNIKINPSDKGGNPGIDIDYFGFNSINEANNARDYFKSSFSRVSISKTIIDVHINNIDLKQVPLFDFNTPVTDDRIMKEFNITQLEMDFINDFDKRLNGGDVDWSKYDSSKK